MRPFSPLAAYFEFNLPSATKMCVRWSLCVLAALLGRSLKNSNCRVNNTDGGTEMSKIEQNDI